MSSGSPFRILAFLFLLPAGALAQGNLTPPGPPQPNMKSLSELDDSLTAMAAKTEPRIAVDTLPGDTLALRIISAPGSYYLRGNLGVTDDVMSGIRIESDGVVLDLNGFALTGSGTASTAAGIETGTGMLRRLIIRNGTLTGWNTAVEGGQGVLAEDLVIENSRSAALELGPDSIARHIQVNGAGRLGISAGIVENCRVTNIGGAGADVIGIAAQRVHGTKVSHVSASGIASVTAIQARLVSHCEVSDLSTENQAWAINAVGEDWSSSYGGSVENCVVDRVTTQNPGQLTGIVSGQVRDSVVRSLNGAAGFFLGIQAKQIRDCTVFGINSTAASASIFGILGGSVRGCSVEGIQGNGGTSQGIQGADVADNHVNSVTAPSGNCYGIVAPNSGRVRGNYVSNVRTVGIHVHDISVVERNNIRAVGAMVGVSNGAAILVIGNGARIENNLIHGTSGMDYGIRVTSPQNFLAGNRCSGTFGGAATGATGVDGAEFNIVAGNRFGAIVGTFAASGEITATNPFANFSD